MIDENKLHGIGRRIENASEGIIRQIEKKAETAGPLNAYIYLIMDAQLNIKNGTYILQQNKPKMFMKELHTALLVAPARVGKTQLALSLLEN